MPSVTLPPVQHPACSTQRTEHEPTIERGTRILLVEDEPLTAEVFARALSRDGHLVEVATDGLQALAHLRDRTPNLVVLDMSLPCLSGADVVRQLRQDGHFKVPVIVVSGSSRREANLTAAELWPGMWLEKPVKPRDLVQIVRDFTRQSD